MISHRRSEFNAGHGLRLIHGVCFALHLAIGFLHSHQGRVHRFRQSAFLDELLEVYDDSFGEAGTAGTDVVEHELRRIVEQRRRYFSFLAADLYISALTIKILTLQTVIDIRSISCRHEHQELSHQRGGALHV